MPDRKLTVAMLVFGVLAFASAVEAQTSSQYPGASVSPRPSRGKSLADQLDAFGRKVFGGILPKDDEKPRTASSDSRSTPRQSYPRGTTRASGSSRAGSVLAAPLKTNATKLPSRARVPQESDPGNYRAVRSRQSGQPLSRGQLHSVRPKIESSTELVARRQESPVRPLAADREQPQTSSADPAGLANPGILPLHERLAAMQKSAFGGTGSGESNSKFRPLSSSPSTARSVDRPENASPSTNLGDITTLPDDPPGEPQVVVKRPTSAVRPHEAANSIRQPRMMTESLTLEANPTRAADSTPSPAARLTATAELQPTQRKDLLFSRKGPILGIETVGPRQIAVGKESVYNVAIQNSGDVAANEVVVFVDLPEWADVLSADASVGATREANLGEVPGPFQWRVGRLEAKGRERLRLHIVPRQSRPFDLAVRWNYQPAVSQTMIEVQEPRLVVNLKGPREVLYGEKEVYRLLLSNSGNGDAENVVITLSPLGAAGNQPVTHNLGMLEAGQEKAIEVELTARQVGNLQIKVEVRGDGGVHAELAEDVLVRRAALQVDLQGPKVQYVDAVASYRIRVRNPGNAQAKGLNLSLNFSAGATYLSGLDDSRLTTKGTKLFWTCEGLNPGAEQIFELKCALGLPGSSRMELVCKADGDLAATANTTTRVEAIADLALDVKDPTGPVPVGKETIYEVRVRNRGTKNAANVEIVAYFSRGIEPTSVDGAQYRIAPGQVVFSPIASVAAGADLVLKVHARAETTGNHIFRAEVHSKALGTRLVSEETTYFYEDGASPQSKSGLADTPGAASAGAMRTATRPGPIAMPSGSGQPTAARPASGPQPPAALLR